MTQLRETAAATSLKTGTIMEISIMTVKRTGTCKT